MHQDQALCAAHNIAPSGTNCQVCDQGPCKFGKPETHASIAHVFQPTRREPWQEQVREEHSQLKERIDKLHLEVYGPERERVAMLDQYLLREQYKAMKSYEQFLAMRLERIDQK